MSENTTAPPGVKPTALFWIVGVVSLLWNSFGGYDYMMTRGKNVEYLSQMGNAQEIVGWIDSFPLWASIGYGLGIWGSVAGSILLLLRSRHAITAFVLSFAGAVVSFAAQMFVIATPPSLDTTANKILPLVILGAIALQWWWAMKQAASGNLR